MSTDPQFVDSSLAKSYTTQASSYVVPDPVVATEYYWRVRASLGTGVVTNWSTVRGYTVGGLEKPVLESPADSSATNIVDVVLDWEPVMGAKTYNLQISTDQNFNTVDHTRVGVMGTRYSPPTTLNNDQYYWRVSPVDSAGNTLDWQDVDVWQFRRHWPSQPALEWPQHNATVGDPFFYQWTPVRNASSYRLEVSTAADFSDNSMYDTCTTVNTAYTPRIGTDCFPQALGTYYWRVIALDSPHSPAVVSDAISAEVRRFTYSPGVVELTAPANGASVEVPTLHWQPMPSAVGVQGHRHPGRHRIGRGQRGDHCDLVDVPVAADRGQDLPLAGAVDLPHRAARTGAAPGQPAHVHGRRLHRRPRRDSGARHR